MSEATRQGTPGNGPGDSSRGDGSEEARARRVFNEISPRSWEHPADRAALQALRAIPIFDEVLRKLFGFFGEKPIRLAFQANAVRVLGAAVRPYPWTLPRGPEDPSMPPRTIPSSCPRPLW